MFCQRLLVPENSPTFSFSRFSTVIATFILGRSSTEWFKSTLKWIASAPPESSKAHPVLRWTYVPVWCDRCDGHKVAFFVDYVCPNTIGAYSVSGTAWICSSQNPRTCPSLIVTPGHREFCDRANMDHNRQFVQISIYRHNLYYHCSKRLKSTAGTPIWVFSQITLDPRSDGSFIRL